MSRALRRLSHSWTERIEGMIQGKDVGKRKQEKEKEEEKQKKK